MNCWSCGHDLSEDENDVCDSCIEIMMEADEIEYQKSLDGLE